MLHRSGRAGIFTEALRLPLRASSVREDTKSGINYKLAISICNELARKIGPALGAEMRPVLGAQPKKKHYNFYDVRFR